MKSELKNALWGEEPSGHCWEVLNRTFDSRSAGHARKLLSAIDATPVVSRDTVEAIWLVPILHLLRGCSFAGSPFLQEASAIDCEVERLLGNWNEVGAHQSDLGGLEAFAGVTETARNQWRLEANGYWALLRLHRAKESDLERFKTVLDNLALPDGPLPRCLLVHLSLMPLGFWNPAPQDLEIRLGLQRQLLPRLGRILGEPFPGAISQILESVSITDFE